MKKQNESVMSLFSNLFICFLGHPKMGQVSGFFFFYDVSVLRMPVLSCLALLHSLSSWFGSQEAYLNCHKHSKTFQEKTLRDLVYLSFENSIYHAL